MQAEVFEEIATMDYPFEGIPTVPPRKDMDHMVNPVHDELKMTLQSDVRYGSCSLRLLHVRQGLVTPNMDMCSPSSVGDAAIESQRILIGLLQR